MDIQDLKNKKNELGLTNRQISELSGVPLGTVQKVFAGVTKIPRYDTIRAIQDALLDAARADQARKEELLAGMDELLVVRDSHPLRAEDGHPISGEDSHPLRSEEAFSKTRQSEESEDGSGLIRYDESNNSSSCQPGVVKEEAFDWYRFGAAENIEGFESKKRQGEYTIEDLYNMPEDWIGELIDGVLYQLNTPHTAHQLIGGYIHSMLLQHVLDKGGECLPLIAPVSVQLDCDDRTMLIPDVMILCDRSKLKGQFLYGAPDFVIEVLSKSTKKRDMTIKLNKYMKAGVREYWMVDPFKEKVIVYFFESDVFATIYTFEDVIPVNIWDDFAIDFKKLKEHTAFLGPAGEGA